MDYRTFGRTGLRVSICGLGGGGQSRLGLAKGSTPEQASAVVRGALDLGITYFDTAPNYGTEEVIGRGLEGRRDEAVISSKMLARADGGGPYVHPSEVRRGLDETLRKLRTDVVDVYHLHRLLPEDYDYTISEIVPELLALRDEGKIRFLGLTESTAKDPDHTVLRRGLEEGCWDVMMTGFTFFNQSARDLLFPGARKHDIAIEIMASARSYFSGDPGKLADEIRRLVQEGLLDADQVDMQDPLGFLTGNDDVGSLTEASYRFVAHEPGVHVVLVGTGNPAHLEENARALSAGPLPRDVNDKLVALFGHLSMAVDAPWRT